MFFARSAEVKTLLMLASIAASAAVRGNQKNAIHLINL
jgi:hypothetical protein